MASITVTTDKIFRTLRFRLLGGTIMAKQLNIKTYIYGELNLKKYDKGKVDKFLLELYYAMSAVKSDKKMSQKK